MSSARDLDQQLRILRAAGVSRASFQLDGSLASVEFFEPAPVATEAPASLGGKRAAQVAPDDDADGPFGASSCKPVRREAPAGDDPDDEGS